MDLETENRLAALLMEEARRLRNEADKDGVHVYLHKPNVRCRPNSRFLTATVLGVEQANRAAEISEMWRAREKERELDAKKRHEYKDKSSGMHLRNGYLNKDSRSWREENAHYEADFEHERDIKDSSIYCSSSKRYYEDSYSRNNVGLHDEELEQFLHSRMKRGRGSIGCRMDEPGPYLPSTSADNDKQIASSPAKWYGEECKRSRPILGPEKPHFLKSHQSHDGVDSSKIQASKKLRHEEKKKSKRETSENNSRKQNKRKHQKN